MCKNASNPVLQLLEAFYLAHIVKKFIWGGGGGGGGSDPQNTFLNLPLFIANNPWQQI